MDRTGGERMNTQRHTNPWPIRRNVTIAVMLISLAFAIAIPAFAQTSPSKLPKGDFVHYYLADNRTEVSAARARVGAGCSTRQRIQRSTVTGLQWLVTGNGCWNAAHTKVTS